MVQWITGLLVQGGVTVAGTLGLGLLIFKTWGEKWLTARFDSQLAEQASAHERELEKLRFRINAMMDRTAKLHQYEFDALPELWATLTDAHGHVSALVSPLQTYPDLDRMRGPELEAFLAKCEVEEWQKVELRESDNKGHRYFKMVFWPRLQKASETYFKFRDRLAKAGIFLQPETQSKMKALADMLWDALRERRFREDHPDIHEVTFNKVQRLRDEGEKLKDAIEAQVRDRLWHVSALD
jgi:cell division protein FtsB